MTAQQTFVCQCDSCPRPIMRMGDCGSTGYAVDQARNRFCFVCCAEQDRATMRAHGKVCLYLTPTDDKHWRVSNWPASLEFTPWNVRHSHGYGFGRRYDRYDFWFAFEGHVWHGVNMGDMQLARCKRTKQTMRSSTRKPNFQVLTTAEGQQI